MRHLAAHGLATRGLDALDLARQALASGGHSRRIFALVALLVIVALAAGWIAYAVRVRRAKRRP